MDHQDKAILSKIAKEPGLPIRHYFEGINRSHMTLYYRVRCLARDGLIDTDSETTKGRKLATLTPAGMEAIRA